MMSPSSLIRCSESAAVDSTMPCIMTLVFLLFFSASSDFSSVVVVVHKELIATKMNGLDLCLEVV